MDVKEIKQAMIETQPPTARGYLIPACFADRLITLCETDKEQASIEWEEYKRGYDEFARRIGG